jgi:hypothetical protein
MPRKPPLNMFGQNSSRWRHRRRTLWHRGLHPRCWAGTILKPVKRNFRGRRRCRGDQVSRACSGTSEWRDLPPLSPERPRAFTNSGGPTDDGKRPPSGRLSERALAYRPPQASTSSRTRVRPCPVNPRTSAALRDTSIKRPSLRSSGAGPRSTIRTMVDRSLARLVTRTRVPNG